MLKKLFSRKEIRFLFSGGLNTVLGYGEVLLLDLFLTYYLAYTFTFIIGIFQSYFLHRYISFRSGGKVIKEFPIFILVTLVTFFIGLLSLHILISSLEISNYIAFAINTIFCA